jgi:DNA-binding response OmpR family regulator
MRVLLIVDDYEDMEPLFRRFLRKAFDEVLFARDLDQADALLATHPVTHLVVDYHLGPGGAGGCDIVASWRARVPTIGFAALFSGTRFDQALPAGIDAAFVKPNGFEGLIDRLCAREP